MLRNALLFAFAAVIVGASVPTLFPSVARFFAAQDVPREAAPAASVTYAASAGEVRGPAVTRGDSGFGEASIAADAGGQFRTSALIEGQPVDMIVDTGATLVAISAETAARLGVYADPTAPKWRVNTANGVSFVSPVTLRQISLGGIEMDNVQAIVMPSGATTMNLLGASFLKRLASVEQRDGMLLLKQ